MSPKAGLRLATSFARRARGLLGSDGEGTLLIAPCGDIHTFGMPFPIDVAFIDAEGTVVNVAFEVKPRRRLHEAGAAAVLERRASDAPWFDIGDRLVVLPAPKGDTCPR